MTGDVVLERLAGDLLEDVLEGDEIETAVGDPSLVGSVETLHLGDVLLEPSAWCLLASLEYLGDGGVGRQSGGVGQQMSDADRVLGVPVGEVVGDAVTQRDPPLLEELHDADAGCHGLRHRCHIEECLDGHRLYRRGEAAVAVGLEVNHFPIPNHRQDATREERVCDGGRDGTVAAGEGSRIHTHLSGGGAREELLLRRAGEGEE